MGQLQRQQQQVWRRHQRDLAKLSLYDYRDNPVKYQAILKAKQWRDKQNETSRRYRARNKDLLAIQERFRKKGINMSLSVIRQNANDVGVIDS